MVDKNKLANIKGFISINKAIVNKIPDYKLREIENTPSYEPVSFNRYELAQHFKSGYACSASQQNSGKRIAENFKVASYVFIDFDDWNLDEALKDDFLSSHGAFIYTTPSHKKDGNGDRFRWVGQLENPIYDSDRYNKLIKSLVTKYKGKCDSTCTDVSRIFFGSENCEIFEFTGLINGSTVEKLISEYEELSRKNSNNNYAKKNIFPIHEIKKALSCIEKMPGYDIWRNVCWAVAYECGDEGKQIINEWSPDYKTGGDEIDKLFACADGSIRIGTLLKYAIERGYQIPKYLINKRTEGQVAYEDIFDNGFNYACVSNASILYFYEDGYYKAIDDAILEKRIADYFDTYITDQAGKTNFATKHKVKSALEFVKSRCFKGKMIINPPGINLKNGYLKISYDDCGQVEFTLLDHSPEYFFSYKADFIYDPSATSEELEQALRDMLNDPNELNIVLTTIAGSFDLVEIRKRFSRPIRILILHGSGQNGKDTLREWASNLFGNLGMTSIRMQTFKEADKRSFGIASLANSVINWASENQTLAIDKCQTLKQVATGDVVTLEIKQVQPFECKPKCILIFNVNEEPIIATNQEAISSRYAVVKFKNVFKSNPNPEKSHEKKANPRFKDDPEFIREKIMPAFLNILIAKYKDLLINGIDYSKNEEYIQQIRSESSHFANFIEECEVVQCDLKEGITASKFYEAYKLWCTNKGYINGDRFNDPHPQYDKVIRHANVIRKNLNLHFSNLVAEKVSGERLLGIKLNKPYSPNMIL